MPFTEDAFSCYSGLFAALTIFDTFFKKQTGVSPQQYRETVMK